MGASLPFDRQITVVDPGLNLMLQYWLEPATQ